MIKGHGVVDIRISIEVMKWDLGSKLGMRVCGERDLGSIPIRLCLDLD